MLIDSLICSLRNLGRKKLRSMLTISGIAIGVASVVIISSIGAIGKDTINRELGALGLGSLSVSADKKLTSQKMNAQDLELIKKNPTVESAVPVVTEYSSIRMRGLVATCMLWGIDGGQSPIISLTPQYGRMLNQTDIVGAADVCVVDSNVARLFYKRDNIVGKRLDALIGGSYVSLEIIGVAASGGSILQTMVGEVIPCFAYIPYTTLQRYQGSSAIEQIAVTLKQEYDPQVAGEQIAGEVNRRHNLKSGFKADNIARQKDTLNNLLDIVTNVLSAIAVVSLVVAGLGIMTVMIVSVSERTREIGIKKSIGATGTVILMEFLIEAFTISLFGSMIGVGGGIALVWAGCSLLSIRFLIDPAIILLNVLLSVGIGVIFGVYPAVMAARLRPADALRTE